MKYGWNNMIGLNINIPIFDNRQNKSAVQKARLQYDSSLLDLINKQKELYKNISKVYGWTLLMLKSNMRRLRVS